MILVQFNWSAYQQFTYTELLIKDRKTRKPLKNIKKKMSQPKIIALAESHHNKLHFYINTQEYHKIHVKNYLTFTIPT